ncbi:hypothetical protein [Mesorhizobium sp. B2-3-6]|uniref:hypothetical protein n=1 Tax=Mesorhizobium sp. B2-3-6 TaxID=2589957 RepID=UPI001FF00E9A|nr:hypothetical protein [Mesorhizobium sp. B2-3-6]
MTYSFYANGICLSHLVADGSLLEADPTQDIQPGRLVAVVLKRDGPLKGFSSSLATNGLLGVTKIFLGLTETSGGEPVYLLGQLNPPTVVTVPGQFLEALHLIVSGQVPPWISDEISDDDDAELTSTLDLLSPFLRAGAVNPIGPDWRPPHE